MPEQGLPINPLQKALNGVFQATPAIWDVLAGDKVFDQLVPPATDATTTRPMPYLAWGNPTDAPHGDASSAFGELGSSGTLQLHIFDSRKYSKAPTIEIMNQIKRAISRGIPTLEGGFKVLRLLTFTTGCFSVPTGQQGMLTISYAIRTTNP